MVNVHYVGNLSCKITDSDTGAQIFTDAPANYGTNPKNFGPTDLVAVALGSCMLTVMAVAAQKNKLDFTNASCSVKKEMTTEGDRRIAAMIVEVKVPKTIPEDKRAMLEHIAHTCPVGRSLHADIKQEVKFIY
jgi:putative redox protein